MKVYSFLFAFLVILIMGLFAKSPPEIATKGFSSPQPVAAYFLYVSSSNFFVKTEKETHERAIQKENLSFYNAHTEVKLLLNFEKRRKIEIFDFEVYNIANA